VRTMLDDFMISCIDYFFASPKHLLDLLDLSSNAPHLAI